jgi:hypothetical protein
MNQIKPRPNHPTNPLAAHRPAAPGYQPLDEATKRRMGELGENAAKITGIVVGALLLGLGLWGAIACIADLYGPPSSSYHLRTAFRLTFFFLLMCAMAIAAGIYVLRATFRQRDTSWTVPLRAFTYIVGARAAAEAAAKNKGRVIEALPGQKNDRTLGPGSSA